MARGWNALLMAAVVLGASPGPARGAGAPVDAHGAVQASPPVVGHARRAEREAKRAARKMQRQMRRQEQQQEQQGAQQQSPAPDVR